MKEEKKCNHNFKYSHIEYPPSGDYSIISPNKDVIICRKCGKIIKTIKI